ncbi:MAG: TraR/DksA C4-type zinc finger protein [Pirellulales bacterium]|nr:TraR/DksA C4-type zinc finger protein [Pirellulales bacterium]
MSSDFSPQVLRCPQCEFSELVLASTAPTWLRKARMLRSNSRATPAELAELLPVAAGKLTCPGCGRRGLVVGRWDQSTSGGDSDWPETPRCEGCGGAIEPERLELMPQTRMCTACQRKTERPGAAVEGEYCPRCGSPMVLRAVRAGITRMQLSCTNPRCR